MPFWTKCRNGSRQRLRHGGHVRPWRPVPDNNKTQLGMPTRGYRKGLSDGKTPLPRQVYARFSHGEHRALAEDAVARGMTVSSLVRAIATAHLTCSRAALPQPRGIEAALIRELVRIGNNVNQLTRQVHTGLVPVSAGELRAALDALNETLRRI